MARVVGKLRVDMSGVQPMYRMAETLAEALATAHFDEPVDVETSREGLRFGGALIAALVTGKIVDWALPVRAVPTIHLPLFAAEICRLAPGVKVRWVDGWPHFSAPGDDDPAEDEPDPCAPEELQPCLT